MKFVTRLVAAAMAAGWAAGAAAPAGGEEDPKATFETLFGAEVRKVQATPNGGDDADLARRVLDLALTANDKPALAAHFLDRAYDLGLKSPAGYETAAKAAEQLQALEGAPNPKTLQKLLDAQMLLHRSLMPRERGPMTDRILQGLLNLGELRGKAGEWEEAQKTYQKALTWCTGRAAGQREEVLARIQNANQQRQATAQLAALKSMVEKKPGDADARRNLVLLLLLDQDRPAEAAKYLNADLGEQMRTYVPLAARPVAELAPAAALELGEWYRQLAERASAVGKATALRRARDAYQRCLEDPPAGSAGDQAKLALQQVTAELEKIPGAVSWVPPGAVLLFNFEKDCLIAQGEQTALRDLSGQDNHGLVRGARPVQGRAGEAFQFNGQADAIRLRNSPSLQTTGSVTIAMWVCPSNLSERRNPFAKAYGGEGTLTIETNGTVYFFCGSSGTDSEPYHGYLMTKPLVTGQWTHLAVVRDLRQRQCLWYQNGVLVNQYPLRHQPKASAAPVTIGSGYVSNFAGLMDELGVWPRALTEREIRLVVEAGAKNKPFAPLRKQN